MGGAVKGIVVLKPSCEATEEELIRFCKERIARYKAPKSIDFISALPKTGSGKIEKKKRKESALAGRKKKSISFMTKIRTAEAVHNAKFISRVFTPLQQQKCFDYFLNGYCAGKISCCLSAD